MLNTIVPGKGDCIFFDFTISWIPFTLGTVIPIVSDAISNALWGC
jgi:hypothetical protein